MSKPHPHTSQFLNDAAIVAIVGTSVTNVAIGGGWLGGAAFGLLVVIPAVIVGAMLAVIVADPPTHARVPLLWALFSALGFEAVRQAGAAPTVALALAGTTFVYGTTRSFLFLRRQALPAGAAAPTAAIAPTDAAELPPVPGDLPEDLSALVAAARRDFDHLRDVLGDPALAGAAGVDVAGMRGEADALLRDIHRRASLVARVRRIADERPDDAPARRTSDDALAALRRQADALRAATSAALQVAAADARDPSPLREHAENLHLLRETREEAQRLD